MKRSTTLGSKTLLCLIAIGLLAPLGCAPNQADLEKAVGEYLKKNPKVIQDAVKAQRPQRAPDLPLEEKIKRAIKVPLNNAPTKGPEDAQITIVEFSDFQCPFCGRVNPTLAQVMKDYPGKVRVAFRNNPLSFHKDAMSAAKASLAAHEQGKFWEMHDKLFENQKDLSDENIQKLAKELGLNVKKFQDSWKSDKFNAVIEEDIKFAQTNQATGTPAFFINGVFLKGAQPVTGFKEVIDRLLGITKAPATPPSAATANPPPKVN